MSLNALAREIYEVNKDNGWEVAVFESWGRPQELLAKLALIHSEVSEAVEAVRDNDLEEFPIELADIIIRVLDLAHGLGLDIDDFVRFKIKKNRGRGYRHGGKAI